MPVSAARALADPWLRSWLVLVSVALLLTALVKVDLLPGEVATVREVQAWAFPGQMLSDAVRAVTGTPFVVVAGVAFAAVHWFLRDRTAALLLVPLLLLLLVTQAGVKEVADRPRPVEAGIEERASSTSPSFPAGHVMSPTVVYGWAIGVLAMRRSALRDRSRRAWADRAALAVAAVLVGVLALSGIANVYLGVHWPTDVLGGYLWGLVLLLPALGLYARKRQAR